MKTRLALFALVALLTGGTVSAATGPRASAQGLLVFGCATCPGAKLSGRLFTIRPDGTGLRMLRESEGASEPRWSPDGRRLAYARTGGSIAIARANGSQERTLTHPIRGAQDSSPGWAPKGKSLVFVRHSGSSTGGDPPTALRTIGADGTKPRLLLTAQTNVVSPDWSPDGRSIAFNDVRERLWVADASGKYRRRLGSPTLIGRQPRWSPDGGRVAFVDVHAADVRVLVLRTGRVRTVFSPEDVTHDVQWFDWGYAWSPDGRRLAVIRTAAVDCIVDPGTEWCEQAQLWIVSLADGRSELIYEGPLTSTTYGIDWRR